MGKLTEREIGFNQGYKEGYEDGYKDSVQRIGHWVDCNAYGGVVRPEWKRYICSVCIEPSYNTKYCPHCGAYMNGEK